ncbi:MAG TPA: histone deacetylase [Candidatus Syntrophoarchaeum butanivorans]|uniref:Histone deacetylase n=1 Tax=Candidatus Syntropharchaeum butanivorans TaxID=1839936 RepID=A0A7J2S4J3_9EURY|nr:histone deacetylase [Candidatus Syntrophoarchaeum butanivorans]
MSTGYVYHPIYLRHNTGTHPERPERLTAILELLKKKGILDRLVKLDPSPASIEMIEYNHDRSYIEHVRSVCEREGALDLDTPVSKDSFDAARFAAGGLVTAVEEVMKERVKGVFALVRPPGHHAERARGMGFCLFNNVAIAAEHLKRAWGLKRILIIDWDVHHGNGTQRSFYEDPTVLYFSTHQYPHYPGTGRIEDVGSGEGKGYTVNVPLPPGVGDRGYLKVMKEILLPIASDFNPEFILISSGSDIHERDPLAGMRVTSPCFARFVDIVKEIGERIAITLEGGYDLTGLSESVLAIFSSLGGFEVDLGEISGGDKERDISELISDIKSFQRTYWRI